jgi:hypothetical protein
MVNNFNRRYVTTEALMKSSGDSLILNAKKKQIFTIGKRLLLNINSGGGTVKPPIRFNTKPLPGTKTTLPPTFASNATTTTGPRSSFLVDRDIDYKIICNKLSQEVELFFAKKKFEITNLDVIAKKPTVKDIIVDAISSATRNCKFELKQMIRRGKNNEVLIKTTKKDADLVVRTFFPRIEVQKLLDAPSRISVKLLHEQ